jgi:hypothetical protein|uniref:Uncharacterized protein n=1 Tax=Oryza sativa subsp. japonica TaxID=39947 RepID=Q84S73_ORYSJ|nr:hypothetical protein [Oryza sativa Japonica Group]
MPNHDMVIESAKKICRCFVATALNPWTHCAYSVTVFQDLRQAFEWMMNMDMAAAVLLEVEMYRRKSDEFGRTLARKI